MADELLNDAIAESAPEQSTGVDVSAPASEAAPVETQVSPPPAPEPAPAAPQTHLVPITALLDVRDRAQAAEREAAELRAWRADLERQRKESLAQAPNILDDPQGYHAFVQNQIAELKRGFTETLQHNTARLNLENSMDKWTDKLGEGEFKKLHDWSATMPQAWVRHAEQQRDPFGFAYKEYEKHVKAQRARDLDEKLGGKDPEAWLEEKRAEWLAAQSAQQPQDQDQLRDAKGKFAPQTQRRSAPSLAAVNGVTSPNGNGAVSGYDALFKSR